MREPKYVGSVESSSKAGFNYAFQLRPSLLARKKYLHVEGSTPPGGI